MKILVYNFVQPDEPGKQGGGVAVYQRNLIRSLLQHGHEVISLSSGDRYAVVTNKPHLQYRRDKASAPGLKRAFIYNSPILAPAHAAFFDLDRYVASTELDAIVPELKSVFGAIDVFHFQNIEGLTARFFEAIRDVFPASRILLTAHNYNLVCPQVNLWFRETSNCVDFRNGHACVNCISGPRSSRPEINKRRMDTLIAHLGVRRHGRVSRVVEKAVRFGVRANRRLAALNGRVTRPEPQDLDVKLRPTVIKSDALAETYARYRERNLGLAETTFDEIIAVSQRTRQVLINHGVAAERLGVSYIGSAHHATYLQATKKTDFGERLHIAFMGYMRADKGFFFFLSCLHVIPDHIAAKIDLTIAAPYHNDWPVEELRAMGQKFGNIFLFNGYSHSSIDQVLGTVTLGIVPVLWEDNLPQVAIEMASRGIPILTSDKGGASEIAANPDFTFKSGSKSDFVAKLARIVERKVSLDTFWQNESRIYSMQEHIDDLMMRYRAGHEATAPAERVSPAGDLVLQ